MSASKKGHAAKHKAGCSCINEGLGMFGFDFVVLGESTVVGKPRESSLDDPALSQNAKANFTNDAPMNGNPRLGARALSIVWMCSGAGRLVNAVVSHLAMRYAERTQ